MIAAVAGCWCPCHMGGKPWPVCSCGLPHAREYALTDSCTLNWDAPYGCTHCHPENPVPGLLHTSAPAPDDLAGLPHGARNHMRRYRQAERRAERLRQQLAVTVATKESHLAALLRLGISERKLAALVGLSRRRVRVLAGGANGEERS